MRFRNFLGVYRQTRGTSLPQVPWQSAERRGRVLGVSLSLSIHALLMSLTFSGGGLGLVGLAFPWQARRAEVADLRAVILPARAPQPLSASSPPASPSPLSEPPAEPVPAPGPVPPVNDEPMMLTLVDRPPPPKTTATQGLTQAAAKPLPREKSKVAAKDALATATGQVTAEPRAERVATPVPVDELMALARSDESTWTVSTVPVVPQVTAVAPSAATSENGTAQAPGAVDTKQEAKQEAKEQELRQEQQAKAEREVAARLEAERRDKARSDAVRAEAARLDAMRAEAARVEAEGREAARQAASRQAALRQEANRQETAKAEAAGQAAAKADAARAEVARQEAARAEAMRAEAMRAEAARQEASRQEAVRQDAAQAEAVRAETARAEGARQAAAQAAARAESARQEGVRAEAVRVEAARLAALQAEAEKREERLRAIGRQLNEEADRRDAAAAAQRQLSPSASSVRRGRLFGRADANAELLAYAEAWGRKIQLNMTFDMVRDAAKQPHADPLVTVAIRSDGSVEAVTFVRSSGVPALDDAIRRTVQSLANYPAFPPGLLRDFDVVEIRRTWHFDMAIRLD